MSSRITIEIPMTAHDRRRVRRIVEAPDGARFPLELATGTVLHPGQVLHRDGPRAYVVAAAPEDVLVIRPRDLAEAARVGHLIGNLRRARCLARRPATDPASADRAWMGPERARGRIPGVARQRGRIRGTRANAGRPQGGAVDPRHEHRTRPPDA